MKSVGKSRNMRDSVRRNRLVIIIIMIIPMYLYNNDRFRQICSSAWNKFRKIDETKIILSYRMNWQSLERLRTGPEWKNSSRLRQQWPLLHKLLRLVSAFHWLNSS